MAEKPITPEGLRALRDEIAKLETVARPEIVQRIKTAREWGDLKENSEYHDAKNDQALLEAKITRLSESLREAVAVEASKADDVAGFGSTVELLNTATKKTIEYTLVGSTEADAAAGRLSAESPVGKALLGARLGETFPVLTPSGQLRFKVVSVS
ncbi:MAG: transcription elongation factor GreA [Solirubrobacterales bacterium]